ncbi:hypothetical protein AZ78_4707 [Lysobacter capsici AZ78]|uniref:Uncharacterized protein n=2 Tax=Lysobacter capsici TaxID=435897 RepID=A0A120AI36_9GAMM|nr:glycoside hydrolase family 75 protein [Lysobacter capsici]KWS07147.1 hypothetical protein AZ78_4707 [Lysobacter capsici AZ78]
MSILVVDRWMDFKGTSIHTLDAGTQQAYAYLSPHISITADGAPDAYHPQNLGLANIRLSGWPDGDWRSALVADPKRPGRPLEQSRGRNAGYYISMTALSDPERPRTDPLAYVDAARIPYLTLPATFLEINGTGALGDFVVAYHPRTRRCSYGVVGDVGQDRPLGEVSIRMASDLSGQTVNLASGKGAPSGSTLYLVFPKSRLSPAWPMAPAAIRARCMALLKPLGGSARLEQIAEALA